MMTCVIALGQHCVPRHLQTEGTLLTTGHALGSGPFLILCTDVQPEPASPTESSEEGQHTGQETPDLPIFMFLKMWHFAGNYFLSTIFLQDVGTEIFQRGNKMQQNISFGDEMQCLWDFLGLTPSHSLWQLLSS